MSLSPNASPANVGIDVSKDSLECVVLPGGHCVQVPNTPEGHQQLLDELSAYAVERIVLEPSGGFERAVMAALAAAGLPVIRVNARRARYFARSLGILAKTDKIDASVLALFAERIRPPVRPLPGEDLQFLEALVARRRQLLEMKVAEQNRLLTCAPALKPSLQAHIEYLLTQTGLAEDEIDHFIQENPLWKEQNELLRSVPAVGPGLARTALADLPELGQIATRKISLLVGVAPLNCDSGKFRGKRKIWGGRAHVRSVLYMATITATRYNPVIRDFYQRLLAKGKPKKVARIACMRKLIGILNAILKNNKPWDPAFAATL